MTDKQSQQSEQEKESELKRPDEVVEDLEPDMEERAAVKGGQGSFSFGASNPAAKI